MKNKKLQLSEYTNLGLDENLDEYVSSYPEIMLQGQQEVWERFNHAKLQHRRSMQNQQFSKLKAQSVAYSVAPLSIEQLDDADRAYRMFSSHNEFRGVTRQKTELERILMSKRNASRQNSRLGALRVLGSPPPQ